MPKAARAVRNLSKNARQKGDHRSGASPFSMAENVVEMSSNWKPPSHFKALTTNHKRFVRAINECPIVIVNGPAGSLKTFLALETSLKMVKNRDYERILYVRQNIDRPNETGLGFREGDEANKLAPLLRPIEDNLRAIMPPGELKYTLRTERIQGSDMEMMRGRSPLDTIIILDEAQNVDMAGLQCVMTRKPFSSKLIMIGDYRGQRDILRREFDAFEYVCREFANLPNFRVINFGFEDIFRDPAIADIIKGFERIKSKMAEKMS